MLKDNRLLIGLGIGLIIGAILLELMNVAITGVNQDTKSSGDNEGFLTEEYSLDQLKDIADSLDYNIIEKSVVYYSQDEMDKAIVNAGKSAISVPVIDAEKVVNGQTTTYRIRIASGMATKDVSELLLTAELISDVDSFKKELNRRNLNESIQVGLFEFDKKPSLTELINKITTQ